MWSDAVPAPGDMGYMAYPYERRQQRRLRRRPLLRRPLPLLFGRVSPHCHSWCCKARRSPASRFALLLGGRAYANSSSASPAAARLAAGTVCSASTGHASRNAAPRPSPRAAGMVRHHRSPCPPLGPPPSAPRPRRRTRADSAWCGRPSLRQSHAPVGFGRGPDAMRHAPLQSLPNRNVYPGNRPPRELTHHHLPSTYSNV